MKTGISRPVDHLGRIVLPVELRRNLGIKPGDYLHIGVNDREITLEKAVEACAHCGNETVLTVDNIHVCNACLRKIKAVLG